MDATNDEEGGIKLRKSVRKKVVRGRTLQKKNLHYSAATSPREKLIFKLSAVLANIKKEESQQNENNIPKSSALTRNTKNKLKSSKNSSSRTKNGEEEEEEEGEEGFYDYGMKENGEYTQMIIETTYRNEAKLILGENLSEVLDLLFNINDLPHSPTLSSGYKSWMILNLMHKHLKNPNIPNYTIKEGAMQLTDRRKKLFLWNARTILPVSRAKALYEIFEITFQITDPEYDDFLMCDFSTPHLQSSSSTQNNNNGGGGATMESMKKRGASTPQMGNSNEPLRKSTRKFTEIFKQKPSSSLGESMKLQSSSKNSNDVMQFVYFRFESKAGSENTATDDVFSSCYLPWSNVDVTLHTVNTNNNNNNEVNEVVGGNGERLELCLKVEGYRYETGYIQTSQMKKTTSASSTAITSSSSSPNNNNNTINSNHQMATSTEKKIGMIDALNNNITMSDLLNCSQSTGHSPRSPRSTASQLIGSGSASDNNDNNYHVIGLDADYPFFANYFYSKNYKVYGVGDPHFIVVCIAVSKIESVKIIIFTPELTHRLTGPIGVTKYSTILRQLENLFPEFGNYSFVQIKAEEVENNLLGFEKNSIFSKYKFGVLYVTDGQTEENHMFSNRTPSEDYQKFLDFLGEKVTLRNWKKFRGGLDVHEDTTGKYSIFGILHKFEIMFHVSTLLPFNEKDMQQLERKRHLGNDVVLLIYKEGDQKFNPSEIHSEFNHIFIVIQKVPPPPSENPDDTYYRVEVSYKDEVPNPAPPILPSPPIFKLSDSFRLFLYTKLINSERIAMKSKQFSTKLLRTRKTLLSNFLSSSSAFKTT